MENQAKIVYITGLIASIALALFTAVSFGLGITATPGGVVPYPYLDTLKLFPRDYFWMMTAFLFIFAYLLLMLCIHFTASVKAKLFGQISIIFSVLSSGILLSDYFIQLSVVPVSLLNNETTGVTLITMYNPHSIFIALEELGYIIMIFSFLFCSFVFEKKERLESFIRWIFISAFCLTILAFALISFQFGIERKDRFEIAVISISWLTLILNGVLCALYFRKMMRKNVGQ